MRGNRFVQIGIWAGPPGAFAPDRREPFLVHRTASTGLRAPAAVSRGLLGAHPRCRLWHRHKHSRPAGAGAPDHRPGHPFRRSRATPSRNQCAGNAGRGGVPATFRCQPHRHVDARRAGARGRPTISACCFRSRRSAGCWAATRRACATAKTCPDPC